MSGLPTIQKLYIKSIETIVNLELAYNKKDVANLEYKVFTYRFINSSLVLPVYFKIFLLFMIEIVMLVSC